MAMAWWQAGWQLVDGNLRSLSAGAKKFVRNLRLTVAVLSFYILTSYAMLVAAFIWPEFDRAFFAVAIFLVANSLWAYVLLIALPLRAKSIVRLIDKGYPENAKELAIRVAARKLHEESIESEELLVETAFNEGRKAYRKYKARAERLKQELDEDPGNP